MYTSLFTAGTATHTYMHAHGQSVGTLRSELSRSWKIAIEMFANTRVIFLHHSTANRWWWCCHVDDDVSWEASHVIASETWCLSSSSTVAHRAEDLGKTSRWL